MTKATDFEVIGAYTRNKDYNPDPDTHIGPIICEPVSGIRHWYCLACDASVNPPADLKARLTNTRDKCGR